MGRSFSGATPYLILVLLAPLLSLSGTVESAQAKVLHVAADGARAAVAAPCGAIADPCGSFAAAYASASPGDVVQVAAGDYPRQTITGAPKDGAPVVFRAAPNASVSAAGLTIERSNVAVADMDLGNNDLLIRAPDVANPPPVDNVSATNISGRNFNIFNATHVTLRGGEWGPVSACGGPFGGSNNSIRQLPGAPAPAHIVIDGTVIHDVQSYDLVGCHIEGLAIFAGTDVTVSRSRFYNNSVYDIFVQANSGPISGLLLENNWFADPLGADSRPNGRAVGFSEVNANVTVRNNSFVGELSVDDNGTRRVYQNFTVTGNVGELLPGACSLAGVTYSYNVWLNTRCAATDVSVRALPYVRSTSAADLDFHLSGGPALDLIPPALSAVKTDIDGDSRPQGAAVDAGADERAVPGSGGASPVTGQDPAATLAPPAGTRRFTAIADAQLDRAHPRRRGGKTHGLRIGRGRSALLRFRVTGLSDREAPAAKLRLWVVKGSGQAVSVRRVGAKWGERSVAWHTMPAVRSAVGRLPASRGGRWVTIALRGLVRGDGVYAIRLSGGRRSGPTFASREVRGRKPSLELAPAG